MKVAGFGEIMLRLSTDVGKMILQSDRFNVNYGGGEANVLISLSHFGIDTKMITSVSNDDIGKSILRYLRSYDIDTEFVTLSDHRTGIYYLQVGSGIRSSKVIYDRDNSAFCNMKIVDIDINSAKEQNPELWARYMQALRTYKQSEHYLSYAHFDNSPEKSLNEGSYLRSLPDSLDIVTLGNSHQISDYDREDIPLLQEKSIRVLYLIDYVAHASSLTDITALNSWLDKEIATSAELNLDGFAFTGLPLYNGTDAELASYKEKSRLIVSKLSTATGQDKLLVLEGNPAFVDEADFDKLNYIVLNTAELTNVTDLKLQVTGILANSLLSKDKLLLSVQMGGQVIDETGVKQEAVTLMTDRVVALGPLAGLGIYAIGNDYYSPIRNYEITRMVIQLMNPSK